MDWLKECDERAMPVIENFPDIADNCLVVEAEVQEDGIRIVFNVNGPEIGFMLDRPGEDDPKNVAYAKKMKFVELGQIMGCKPSEINAESIDKKLIGKIFTVISKDVSFVSKQSGRTISKRRLEKMVYEGQDQARS